MYLLVEINYYYYYYHNTQGLRNIEREDMDICQQ